MCPVDATPYATPPAAQTNPLGQVGQLLQIQGAAINLQNAQMEMRARQALGPIIQQSIDPNSGEFDINKFLIHGAANPDVAWKMPELTLQMIQRQNVQADTLVKQLEANKVRYGAIGDLAGSLVAQAMTNAQSRVNVKTGQPGAPSLSQRELTEALSNPAVIGENGLMDVKDATDLLAKTAGMTDQQRFQLVKRTADTARGVDKTMTDIYGHIVAHNTGGQVTVAQESPLTGTSRPVQGYTQTPTPEQMNTGVVGTDASGRPTYTPRVNVAPMVTGAGAQVPGSGAGGNAAVTGLNPERLKSANDYENALTESNTAAQEDMRVLREMRTALMEFKSGGGMEVRQHLAQLAQAIVPPGSKLPDEIAGGNRGAIAEFQKLAVQHATQEMKTRLGTSQRFTNLDFATFLKNNPTIDTDPRGLDKLFGFVSQGAWLLGQQQAAYNDWKNGKIPVHKGYSTIDQFPAWWTRVLQEGRDRADQDQAAAAAAGKK